MAFNKEKTYYLNDLPLLLNSLSLISYHGMGRGGGEIVANKIIDYYLPINKNLKILNCTNSLFKRFISLLKTKKKDIILFT